MADTLLANASGQLLVRFGVGGVLLADDHCCCCALDLAGACPGTYTVDVPNGYARWVSAGSGATTLVLTYDPATRLWFFAEPYTDHLWSIKCIEYPAGTLDRDGNPLPKGRAWRLQASAGGDNATWWRFEETGCPPVGVWQVYPYPPTDPVTGNFNNYALQDATVS